MKVRELIEALNECDPEALVVLSSDGEGNRFSPVDGYDDRQVYIPETTWSGSTKFAELTPELEKAGYDEEDCVDEDETDAVPCVILWPVN